MAHGGRRQGAGRKQGALTVRTREVAAKALAAGKTPLEVMLDNMRHFQQLAIDAEAALAGLTYEEFVGRHGDDLAPADKFKALLAEVKKTAGLRQMAHECARDAASYMHPRLTAVQHSGAVDTRPAREKTDEELATILAGADRGGAGNDDTPLDPSQLN